MNRGDVWFVDLGGRAGRRPAVILTRQAVLDYLNKVTVAEISTRGKGYPTEVFIDTKGNLPSPSYVKADNIHTVPKESLVKYSGTLDEASMVKISRKVILALGLEALL